MTKAEQNPVHPSADQFETFTPSPHFAQWLSDHRVALAVTAYHTGLFFLIGVDAEARLSARRRTFDHCMGLAGDGQTLWMSTRYQLLRFENALDHGATFEGHDRLYVPRMSFITGAVDTHDVGLDATGRPVFVATRFNCIAAPSETHSFRPLWKPPFIRRLVDGDCCHLNGLAMSNGIPRYATAVSTTNSLHGWRQERATGGVLIDIATNDTVLDGLSMPHSPRLAGDVLYLADSGTGRFGWVDRKRNRFEEITFCPGFIRGMAIHPPFAVVGVSRLRHENLSGLRVEEELQRRNMHAYSGVVIIDLRNGKIVHWLRIEGAVHELYDAVVLSGVGRPMALGIVSDQIEHLVTPDVSSSNEAGSLTDST